MLAAQVFAQQRYIKFSVFSKNGTSCRMLCFWFDCFPQQRKLNVLLKYNFLYIFNSFQKFYFRLIFGFKSTLPCPSGLNFFAAHYYLGDC